MYVLFYFYVGGVDKQYKRGEFYPGAFQFFYELSSYHQKKNINLLNIKKDIDNAKNSDNNNNDYNDNNDIKYIVDVPTVSVLTARAREFLFALALKPNDKICSAFRKVGLANGSPSWGVGDVYYGSVEEWWVVSCCHIKL